MTIAVSLLGLGFNLSKTSFDSKKRTLENLGYTLKEMSYTDENMRIIEELYSKNKNDVLDSYMDSGAQIDAWLAGEDNKCTDGCDDGKISLFSKFWNYCEGKVKTVVGSLRSLFSDPKKAAKFVLTAGAMAAISFLGGPIGVAIVGTLGFVAACGLINNGIKDFKDAVKTADSATTDSEAKAAFEQMGSGALQAEIGVVCAYNSSSSLFSEYQEVSFLEEFCSNLKDISVLADKS